MKRIFALLLCMALCLPVRAAEVGRAEIGGITCMTVTVPMGEGVRADVILSEGSVSRESVAKDLLTAAGDAEAVVNGGFFNAYYARSPVEGYGSAPLCQVNLVRDGRAVFGCGGGQTAVYLGVTKDGKALIDEVGVTLYVETEERRLPTWGVNGYWADPDAILLFTPEAGCDLPLFDGARAARIVDGRVTTIQTSGLLSCTENTCYLVCGKNLWDRLPAVGEEIRFSTEFDKEAWQDVTAAVSCGPWLLHDGESALEENGKWNYLSDAKVSADVSAGRTFAAVTAEGNLLLGACTASPRQIMEYLRSAGARDAMLLDGGASSLLCANGNTLVPAGRKLNHVLAFYGAPRTAPAPAVTPPAPAEPETPPETPPEEPPRVVPTRQSLTVDGAAQSVEAYNIGGVNFFKLRDVAALLSGTGSRFRVDYDAESNRVLLRTGESYEKPVMPLPDEETMQARAASAVPSPQSLLIDGAAADLTAYNISGSNFFALRDLGRALGFDVSYDAETATVRVQSRP